MRSDARRHAGSRGERCVGPLRRCIACGEDAGDARQLAVVDDEERPERAVLERASELLRERACLMRPGRHEERIDADDAAIGETHSGDLRRIAQHLHYARPFYPHMTRFEQCGFVGSWFDDALREPCRRSPVGNQHRLME